jgi:hypothetical protein
MQAAASAETTKAIFWIRIAVLRENRVNDGNESKALSACGDIAFGVDFIS